MKYLGHGVTAKSRTGRRIGPNTEDLLRQAVDRAHNWLDVAITEVEHARAHPNAMTLINDMHAAGRVLTVRRAAVQAFNAPNEDTVMSTLLGRVATALDRLENGLGAGYQIVDIDMLTRIGDVTGGCTGGYVSQHLIGDGFGRIHLNYKLFRRLGRINLERTRDIAAWTLLHEGTHKFSATRDRGYVDHPSFRQLSWSTAVGNADSISAFIFLLAHPEKLDLVAWPRAPYLW
ncbi:MAG: hypothetical protein R3F65_23405 [bacterium]